MADYTKMPTDPWPSWQDYAIQLIKQERQTREREKESRDKAFQDEMRR